MDFNCFVFLKRPLKIHLTNYTIIDSFLFYQFSNSFGCKDFYYLKFF